MKPETKYEEMTPAELVTLILDFQAAERAFEEQRQKIRDEINAASHHLACSMGTGVLYHVLTKAVPGRIAVVERRGPSVVVSLAECLSPGQFNDRLGHAKPVVEKGEGFTLKSAVIAPVTIRPSNGTTEHYDDDGEIDLGDMPL